MTPLRPSNRILDRYLFLETGGAWLAVALVLLAIMLSTRFARYVGQAAAGDLPRDLLMQVVGLSSLQYLPVLIPVSWLLAIMLALGRLYKDNEAVAMMGCGVGLWGLYRPVIGLGIALSLIAGSLALQISPWAGRTADYKVKQAARFIQFTPFEPGHFKEVAGGRATFYTAGVSADGRELQTVFAQIHEDQGDSIIVAQRASQTVDAESGDRDIRLADGWRYLGEAGRADYEVTRFAEFATRVAPPSFIYFSGKRALKSLGELLASSTVDDAAELQWRLSAPLSVLILTLLAVPLAQVRPRQGRYGKVVIGILIYLAYSQLIGVAQVWIAKGKLPPQIGLWPVHAAMLLVAIGLIGQRERWGLRSRA